MFKAELNLLRSIVLKSRRVAMCYVLYCVYYVLLPSLIEGWDPKAKKFESQKKKKKHVRNVPWLSSLTVGPPLSRLSESFFFFSAE